MLGGDLPGGAAARRAPQTFDELFLQSADSWPPRPREAYDLVRGGATRGGGTCPRMRAAMRKAVRSCR
jgi:hypothetical protein